MDMKNMKKRKGGSIANKEWLTKKEGRITVE